MSRPRSRDRAAPGLGRNASWAFAGNVVYAATQWLALVALARLGTPAAVGQFALGMAVGAPVALLGNLQLRSVLATDARGEHAWADYLGLRLVTTLLALVVIAGIALGYQGHAAWVIALVGVAKAIESVSDLYYGLMQQHERMDVMARSLIARGALGLGALAAGLALTGDVRWAVAGMAGAWGVILLAHDLPAASALSPPGGRAPRFERAAMRGLARVALPLGLTTLFLSLDQNIPRYVVERYLGEASLGVFAAMAYVQVAGEVVIRALGQTSMPRLARHWAAGERHAFARLLRLLLALGCGLGAAGVGLAALIGEPVLRLLFGAPFAAEADVFTWLMLAAAFTWLGSLLGYAVSATRAFARFTAPYALVAVVAAVASALWIPRHGLHGAAWALCVIGVATCLAPLSILRAQRRPA
jgi:O-antigen/teichoic acid export membrane protein